MKKQRRKIYNGYYEYKFKDSGRCYHFYIIRCASNWKISSTGVDGLTDDIMRAKSRREAENEINKIVSRDRSLAKQRK